MSRAHSTSLLFQSRWGLYDAMTSGIIYGRTTSTSPLPQASNTVEERSTGTVAMKIGFWFVCQINLDSRGTDATATELTFCRSLFTGSNLISSLPVFALYSFVRVGRPVLEDLDGIERVLKWHCRSTLRLRQRLQGCNTVTVHLEVQITGGRPSPHLKPKVPIQLFNRVASVYLSLNRLQFSRAFAQRVL
jgi:hypothetical protein